MKTTRKKWIISAKNAKFLEKLPLCLRELCERSLLVLCKFSAFFVNVTLILPQGWRLETVGNGWKPGTPASGLQSPASFNVRCFVTCTVQLQSRQRRIDSKTGDRNRDTILEIQRSRM